MLTCQFVVANVDICSAQGMQKYFIDSTWAFLAWATSCSFYRNSFSGIFRQSPTLLKYQGSFSRVEIWIVDSPRIYSWYCIGCMFYVRWIVKHHPSFTINSAVDPKSTDWFCRGRKEWHIMSGTIAVLRAVLVNPHEPREKAPSSRKTAATSPPPPLSQIRSVIRLSLLSRVSLLDLLHCVSIHCLRFLLQFLL